MDFKIPKKIDQYRKIREMALAGKLGAAEQAEGECVSGCVYRNGDLRCGVGALFNDAQLDNIEELGLNTCGIDVVADNIGYDNIETVTGFTIKELIEIQGQHDAIILNGYLKPDFSPLIRFLHKKIKELKSTT